MPHEAAAKSPVPGPLAVYYAKCEAVPAGNYVVIEPGTNEWRSWSDHFLRTYRRRPHVMDLREDGSCKAFAVPAQWPDWFDAAAPDEADARRAPPPRVHRAPAVHVAPYRREELASSARHLAHAMRMQPDGRRARNGTATIPRETPDEALVRLRREGAGGVVLSASLTAQLAERHGGARREEAA